MDNFGSKKDNNNGNYLIRQKRNGGRDHNICYSGSMKLSKKGGESYKMKASILKGQKYKRH